ncbi:hypothetical protein TWF788_007973 [Orbilia oligospora]|uniref:NmrA-like domain-containing protein n=1 Tax=Orbilia oligospora TaxID=2813651 RepID=A0A6G1MA73_ORBOL|nr:hypothetical protein TWF788_007973 [Orbilia oligospora]KAF3207465.1 hypothetical protein TWF191_001042 [Orbilia oligospora]KAF3251367.1 hypothetical protein TWF192_004863 [Orbilia oligospora]
MAEYFKNVLLIGATGDLGQHILSALLNTTTTHPSQPLAINLLTRLTSTAEFPADPSITRIHKGDIKDREFLVTAFSGQDIVISAISPYALLDQKLMLSVAAEVGVKRFVVGEFGMDTRDEGLTDSVAVFQQNREVLEYAVGVCGGGGDRKAVGMEYTGVICGAFLEMTLLDGEMGFGFGEREVEIYDSGRKKIEVSRMEDVARATVEICFQPGRYRDQLVYISSFTVSQRDILGALNKVDKKGPWKVVERTTEWLKGRGKKRVEEGDMMGLVDEIWAVAFSDGIGEAFSRKRKLVNEEVGIRRGGDEEFVEVIRGIVEDWEAGRRK